ncbi:MAG: lipoprotein [Polaromonas sp.]
MVSSYRSSQILGRLRAMALRHGLVAIVVGSALTGCGQKGPLFIPVIPALPTAVAPNPTAASPSAVVAPSAAASSAK